MSEREQQFHDFIKGKYNCARTVSSYTSIIKDFREYCRDLSQNLEPAQYVRSYVLSCLDEGDEGSYVNLKISAIRTYYREILKIEIDTKELPYVKVDKKPPVPFSREEIIKVFSVVVNRKHLALLGVYYGCGLRLSELVKMKVSQVDLNRRTLYVGGKGKKYRFASIKEDELFSLVAEQCLNKDPGDPVFESGARPGEPICIRTAQKVFFNACEKANVSKRWNVHRLRHSFATHLLEKNTNIVHIRDLLGHANLKTTMTYLHVTNEALSKIQSPIVGIFKRPYSETGSL